MLGYGFAFSLVVIGGVGSVVALVIGLRARRMIKRSGGELTGLRLAWWCIIAGGVGTAVLPLTVWLVIKALSK